jgi:mRNA-degrading endonuclease RelE of RelBE toxin-antitoxin system
LQSYKVHLAGSFKRDVKKLKRRYRHVKDDLDTAIKLLKKDPRIAVVIPGSSGMRKLRIPNRDQQRGKSGGYRLIYYVQDQPIPTIYLLCLYSKSHQQDLATSEMKQRIDELTDLLAE